MFARIFTLNYNTGDISTTQFDIDCLSWTDCYPCFLLNYTASQVFQSILIPATFGLYHFRNVYHINEHHEIRSVRVSDLSIQILRPTYHQKCYSLYHPLFSLEIVFRPCESLPKNWSLFSGGVCMFFIPDTLSSSSSTRQNHPKFKVPNSRFTKI